MNRWVIRNGPIMVIMDEQGGIDELRKVEEGVYLFDLRIISRLKIFPRGFKMYEVDKELNRNVCRFKRLLSTGGTYKILLDEEWRIVNNALTITLDFTNETGEKLDILLDYVIDYNHSDMFDIRARVGHFSLSTSGIEAHLRREENGVVYESRHIRAEVKHDLQPEKLELLPHGKLKRTYTLSFSFKLEEPKEVIYEFVQPRHHLREISVEKEGDLGVLLKKAVDDIRKLFIESFAGTVPVAGLPWFSAVFGRDSLVFVLETSRYYPELSRNILTFLSRLQGSRFNAFREEQPGKILHEARLSERCLSGELPFSRYYGSIDSTLLYLLAMYEYWKNHGDDMFVKMHISNIIAALNWIEEYGDVDGDGYVEYRRGVLKNQGWKDSDEALMDEEGNLPEGPIALAEVQAYFYGALIGVSEMAEVLGINGQKYLEKAQKLKEQFNRDFWMEGEAFFAVALDGHKNRIDHVTSNPAHGLMTGILDSEKAKLMVRRLMSDDMFTRWGIRTMSSRMPMYNPFSYHNGSIWPHDNALIIKGLQKYGFHREARRVAIALLNAARHFNYHLPELYTGYNGEKPIPYPEACVPQLWSAGSAFVIFEVLKNS